MSTKQGHYLIFIPVFNKINKEKKKNRHELLLESIFVKKLYTATILELMNLDIEDIEKMNVFELHNIAIMGYEKEFNQTINITHEYIFGGIKLG